MSSDPSSLNNSKQNPVFDRQEVLEHLASVDADSRATNGSSSLITAFVFNDEYALVEGLLAGFFAQLVRAVVYGREVGEKPQRVGIINSRSFITVVLVRRC
ncbi:MAG: hypothetical protein HXK15_04030 [Actinomyces sp.]|nr:hypothetical protein [Actinomyces sp.]